MDSLFRDSWENVRQVNDRIYAMMIAACPEIADNSTIGAFMNQIDHAINAFRTGTDTPENLDTVNERIDFVRAEYPTAAGFLAGVRFLVFMPEEMHPQPSDGVPFTHEKANCIALTFLPDKIQELALPHAQIDGVWRNLRAVHAHLEESLAQCCSPMPQDLRRAVDLATQCLDQRRQGMATDSAAEEIQAIWQARRSTPDKDRKIGKHLSALSLLGEISVREMAGRIGPNPLSPADAAEMARHLLNRPPRAINDR